MSDSDFDFQLSVIMASQDQMKDAALILRLQRQVKADQQEIAGLKNLVATLERCVDTLKMHVRSLKEDIIGDTLRGKVQKLQDE